MGSEAQQNVSYFPLLLLLLFLGFQPLISRGAEARPLPFLKQVGYVKVLASLGLTCRCCDGVGGECRDTWDSACAKLDCHPWKFY